MAFRSIKDGQSDRCYQYFSLFLFIFGICAKHQVVTLLRPVHNAYKVLRRSANKASNTFMVLNALYLLGQISLDRNQCECHTKAQPYYQHIFVCKSHLGHHSGRQCTAVFNNTHWQHRLLLYFMISYLHIDSVLFQTEIKLYFLNFCDVQSTETQLLYYLFNHKNYNCPNYDLKGHL